MKTNDFQWKQTEKFPPQCSLIVTKMLISHNQAIDLFIWAILLLFETEIENKHTFLIIKMPRCLDKQNGFVKTKWNTNGIDFTARSAFFLVLLQAAQMRN